MESDRVLLDMQDDQVGVDRAGQPSGVIANAGGVGRSIDAGEDGRHGAFTLIFRADDNPQPRPAALRIAAQSPAPPQDETPDQGSRFLSVVV